MTSSLDFEHKKNMFTVTNPSVDSGHLSESGATPQSGSVPPDADEQERLIVEDLIGKLAQLSFGTLFFKFVSRMPVLFSSAVR